jgi:hypothetical protein
MLRILSGGAVNILFISALITFYKDNVPMINGVYTINTTLLFEQVWALIIMVIISPFLLSLILTKRKPNLRLVPPFYIAWVSYVWLIIVQSYPFSTTTVTDSVLLGGIFVAICYLEDRAVTLILGITAERENIFFEHFKAFAQIEDVRNKLSVPEIRSELTLSPRTEGNSELGYRLHTRREFTSVNRILLTRDKEYPDELTDVKVVYYAMGRYSLTMSPYFLEHWKKTSGYLKDIFTERDPIIGIEKITDFQNNVRDPLVDSVVDDLMGYYVKSQRVSMLDKIKVGATIGIFVIAVYLFVIGQPVYGGLSAILDAIFALSELPDILRRQA